MSFVAYAYYGWDVGQFIRLKFWTFRLLGFLEQSTYLLVENSVCLGCGAVCAGNFGQSVSLGGNLSVGLLGGLLRLQGSLSVRLYSSFRVGLSNSLSVGLSGSLLGYRAVCLLGC